MFSSILVPVDLAEPALAMPAINAAVTFAKSTNGRVRLVYVRSLVPVTYMEFVPADFDVEQQADCERRLNELAPMVDLPKDKVSTKVLLGSIHSETLREAESWGADLVVVWSHRPGFAAYLLGSNAATIVRHAKCSVLVVRDPLQKS